MVEEAAGVGEGKENGGAIEPWVGDRRSVHVSIQDENL
jgi:hypothetical protein